MKLLKIYLSYVTQIKAYAADREHKIKIVS
jgi:hypothetical protein